MEELGPTVTIYSVVAARANGDLILVVIGWIMRLRLVYSGH